MVYSAISDSSGTISQFTRKKPLVVSHSGALTAYQKMVTVTYEPGMLSNFGDIRFVTKDGTHIPYWIEKKTDGDNATVWFKSDFADGDTVVWLYYGNAGLAPESGGADVFPYLFDGFVDNEYTSNPVWTPVTGSWSAASGYLVKTATGGSWQAISTPSTSMDGIWEADFKLGSTAAADRFIFWFLTVDVDNYVDVYYESQLNDVHIQKRVAGTETTYTQGKLTADTNEHRMTIKRVGDLFTVDIDGTQIGEGVTISDNVFDTSATFQNKQIGTLTRLNRVFHRQYTATEPTSVWGEPQHQRRVPTFL